MLFQTGHSVRLAPELPGRLTSDYARLLDPAAIYTVEETDGRGTGLEPHWEGCPNPFDCPCLGLRQQLIRLSGAVATWFPAELFVQG